jgi:mRNA-degrading endonuclease RelE of RelBE toxin-antitoxin system
VSAALQIWSHTFSKSFDTLPAPVREVVLGKIDMMGTRLETFPHKRLQGRAEFKLRAGDYRVLYEFDLKLDRIFLHYVGHRREIYQRT